MHTVGENMKSDLAIGPQVVATAGAVDGSVFYSMANTHTAQLVFTATLTATKTAVCALLEATDAAGTSKGAISGKAVTLTGATGGSEESGTIDFRPEDMTSTKIYAGARVTTNQNDDAVSAVLIRAGQRFKRTDLMG